MTYRAALDWLKAVARGDLDIHEAASVEDGGNSDGAMATAPAPRFGRAALSGI